ncbi:hypothetical protein GDO86_017529 [Hymenochirus boettgeri]|uniref:Uncharacterized protein n=1 Tax=Hymenochirus boettgeri TaxID=247094 RepID=A0A8T2INA0_9PIPI|nr:hypothetical protein GDO86_017529 [Hymenochirus boettgeri]
MYSKTNWVMQSLGAYERPRGFRMWFGLLNKLVRTLLSLPRNGSKVVCNPLNEGKHSLFSFGGSQIV